MESIKSVNLRLGKLKNYDSSKHRDFKENNFLSYLKEQRKNLIKKVKSKVPIKKQYRNEFGRIAERSI